MLGCVAPFLSLGLCYLVGMSYAIVAASLDAEPVPRLRYTVIRPVLVTGRKGISQFFAHSSSRAVFTMSIAALPSPSASSLLPPSCTGFV